MKNEVVSEKNLQLAEWLAGDWLEKGPRVFVIEGFAGVGKTYVARKTKDILETKKIKIPIVHIDMSETLSAEMDELKLELAMGLEEAHLDDIANDVLNNDFHGLWRILDRLLSRKILVIIDDFQRCFTPQYARPPKPIVNFLKRVSWSDHLPGRVLLISNRRLERDTWSGFFKINFLEGVSGQKGVRLFEYMLESEGCLEEVSSERRTEIVRCLGGNPRAMWLLAASLKFDSLDELIGVAPELWALDERQFSPQLLHKLERGLLERALKYLSQEEVKALRILSVYRKAFKKEAFDTAVDYGLDPSDLRSQFISRFLMEHHRGWFAMHPIVREICHHHLNRVPAEGAKGHSRAADYYMRFFKAKVIKSDQQRLSGHFLEVRFHLVQAGREQDLEEIAGRFGNYLRKTMGPASPVPQDRNVLNERIAVLSVYLKNPGNKGMEYYLAKLLAARNREEDKENALIHARRATGPHVDTAYWVFRVNLEKELVGVDAAIDTAGEGISKIPPDKNIFALYQSCGELLANDGRVSEAIELLKEGISKIPPDKSLVSLYQSCGELLAKDGRVSEAIELLKEGIARIPYGKYSRNSLVQDALLFCFSSRASSR